MRRDPRRLAAGRYDLLVIGGGIQGAALLREAALQGWSAALIEQGDFGGATSANSLKIIHGGLRYLQHGDIPRTRQSVAARRRFLRIAPHLVRPLPCVLPTYRWSGKNRVVLRTALTLNDLLSRDRNEGVRRDRHIPDGTLMSREELLSVAPGLPEKGLTGGALWYDCFAENTERLTLGFIVSAVDHDAAAANYVRAEDYLLEGNRVVGVKARDLVTGEELSIESRLVVDATGPWRGSLGGTEGANRPCFASGRWAKAANIIIGRRLFDDHALALSRRPSGRAGRSSRAGQVHFFVPWRRVTLVGTWYWKHRHREGGLSLRPEELREMIEDVNAVYPPAGLRPEDVAFVHLGMLPLEEKERAGPVSIQLRGRSRIVDCEKEGGPGGLIGIESVKYTTSCAVAQDALRLAAAKLGKSIEPLREDPPLFGRPPPSDGDDDPVDLAADLRAHLRLHYGERSRKLFDLIALAPGLGEPLVPSEPTTGAEVVYAVREEMATSLADVVFRRTGLGSAGNPGAEALEQCAALMGAELTWGREREEGEIASAAAAFKTLTPPR